MTEYIIVLDQGSSSSRALAVDRHGVVKFKVLKPLQASYPREGMAEYDASALLQSQLKALEELLRKLPRSARPVAMGIAAQRSTFVLWDRKTGTPLCPALSWQDGRAVKELDEAGLDPIKVHFTTGLYKTPYYSASKMLWCIKNLPEVKAARDSGRLMAGPVTSFLIWHLTRGDVFAADPTMAQRTLLFNIKRSCWDESLLGSFSIPSSILPAIRPTVGAWGEYRKGRLKIPVNVTIGDQQAAVAGLGVNRAGMTALNYGTGAFLLCNTGREMHQIPGLLTSVGLQDGSGKNSYLLEGTVNSAASTLEWMKILGLLDNIKEADSMCRASKGGVMVLPALGGLGAPRWDYLTSTTMTGFNSQTRRNDIVRGCVEGIACLVTDIAVLLKSRGLEPGETRASGGLAGLDYMMQFQANLFQRPVMRMVQPEATAAGAAMLAAGYAGMDVSDWPLDRAEKRFEPAVPAAEAEKLIKRWKAFVENCRKMSRDLNV
ncbi:MAG: FGGY family carbohydrate kinase [bacterium]